MSARHVNKRDGYVRVRAPDHPRADPNGYVLEHIVVAEQALGKALPPGAEVHHVSGDRGNNHPQNLVICQDHAYHMLLHARQAARDACGHAAWRKCWACKEWDDPANLHVEPSDTYHVECRAAWQRARLGPSKYAGVHRIGSGWRVQVRLGGQTVYSQTFADEREAARAYDLTLIELGEESNPRCRLNVYKVIDIREPQAAPPDAWDEPWFEVIQPDPED